jgi:hypothetical protein
MSEEEKQYELRFNGPVYEPKFDQERLTGQILRIFDLMGDGEWRTLGEIEGITSDPPASISAQLRHLRKERFGSHTVNKRPRGDRENGLWEYQLLVHGSIPKAGAAHEADPNSLDDWETGDSDWV